MSKIPENVENYSKKVEERFIQLINENKLYSSSELKIITALFKKYELVTIPDYATKIGKTYNGVMDMISRKKVAVIEISNKTFVINKLN